MISQPDKSAGRTAQTSKMHVPYQSRPTAILSDDHYDFETSFKCKTGIRLNRMPSTIDDRHG
jgi:hypothetical protein